MNWADWAEKRPEDYLKHRALKYREERNVSVAKLMDRWVAEILELRTKLSTCMKERTEDAGKIELFRAQTNRIIELQDEVLNLQMKLRILGGSG